MTDDFIDQSFADLDDFYPGSKRKRQTRAPKPREIEPIAGWDKKPKVITLPNGNPVEMFTIGAVADALGRPIRTIRMWISEGYLPASPYRLPSSKNYKGEDHAGYRLYSRAMVEKVIELLDSAGLLYVKRIDWSANRQLSIEIAEAWNQIRATETKTKDE